MNSTTINNLAATDCWFETMNPRFLTAIACVLLVRPAFADPAASTNGPAQVSSSNSPAVIPLERMQQVYATVKTPYKFGIVLRPKPDTVVDCPRVFRFGDRWYMLYVESSKQVGYETHLARSENLLDWQPLGTVLSFQTNGWDKWQADGGMALVDPTWGGSCQPETYDGKYWMSYLGGALQGYEPDPLAIGMAWTTTPNVATSKDFDNSNKSITH